MGWRNWLVNTQTCAMHSCRNLKDLRHPNLRLRLPMLLRQRMPWCSCMGKCNVRCKECHSGVEPGREHLGEGIQRGMARALQNDQVFFRSNFGFSIFLLFCERNFGNPKNMWYKYSKGQSRSWEEQTKNSPRRKEIVRKWYPAKSFPNN